MNQQQRRERVIAGFVETTPSAMYDIGVGLKTEWLTLGKIWPEMKIFGCEPCLRNYFKILPKFPGKLFPVALGDKPGKRILYLHPKNPTEVEVPVWTLDYFDYVADRPDNILLWMDIEGAELLALKGGQKLIESKRVKWINLEQHFEPRAEGWVEPEQLHQFLVAAGYERRLEYGKSKDLQDVIYTLKM